MWGSTKKLFILVCVFALAPFVSLADTEITNNVSVSASSGGNSASGGEVVTGTQKASVHVETIVDGEAVEKFERIEISDNGSVNIEYHGDGVEVSATASATTPTPTSTLTVEAQKELNKILQALRELWFNVFTFFKTQ